MSKYVLNLRGKVLREFVSFRQMAVWVVDILQKVGLLLLVAFAGVLPEFLKISGASLASYIGIYSLAILLWGLLLLKYVLGGKNVFEKTKFDFFLMGLMSLFLIVVLLSENRVEGVFGTGGTYSLSVITLLAISIIYYVGVLVFKYIRGIKWLGLGLLFSLLVGGIYQIEFIIKDESINNREYLLFGVLAIPLSLGLTFLFRKMYLKVVSLISIVINLYVIAYYSDYLSGAMFVLSVGVLALFLLFYFSFWIRNSSLITNYLRDVVRKVRDIKQLVNFIKSNRKQSLIIVIVIFMALWIIGFALFGFNYFENDLWPYLKGEFEDAFSKMQGIRMWLVGENDLTKTFSSIEFMSILGNYGIISVLVYVMFLLYCIYKSGKLVLSMLYSGSFKNVVLLSGIFVTFVSVMLVFLISRINPLIYILFLICLTLLSILESLMRKEASYSLQEIKGKMNTRTKIVKIILSVLIITLMLLGIIGLNAGINEGLF